MGSLTTQSIAKRPTKFYPSLGRQVPTGKQDAGQIRDPTKKARAMREPVLPAPKRMPNRVNASYDTANPASEAFA